MSMKPAVTPQQAQFTDPQKGKLALYKELAVGDRGYLSLAYYEFCMFFFSNLTALPGFASRAALFPRMFAKCGSKNAFGRGLIIRNPGQTSLGSRIIIDDYATLDVRGTDASIDVSDYACIGRFTTIAAKNGHISLAPGVNIGSYCRIATNSKIEIGESALIAAYAYIGPGNHQRDDGDKPLIASEMEIKGGVKIGAHSWIGARATILDGVTIGKGAIVGAHSLVREDVPDGAVVAGTPAKIISKPG